MVPENTDRKMGQGREGKGRKPIKRAVVKLDSTRATGALPWEPLGDSGEQA